MIKKISFFSMSLFLLFSFVAQAQNSNSEELTESISREETDQPVIESSGNLKSDQVGSFLIATVNVVDFKITKQDRNKFDLSFLVTNREKAQPNIKYGINLLKINKEEKTETLIDEEMYSKIFSPEPDPEVLEMIKTIRKESGEDDLFDEKIYSEVFDLGPNSEVLKNIKYEAPEYLNGDFVIRLVLKNDKGLILGTSSSEEFTLNGDQKFLEIIRPSCYLTIKGENPSLQYTPNQKVDLKFEEDLALNCQIKNNTDLDLKINPTFETFVGSAFNKEIKESEKAENNLEINKNETKEIQINIPKNSNPQEYYAKVFLHNDKNISADFITVSYIISGRGATIQNILLDKNYYKKGEEAKVSFFYSKLATSFLDSRTQGTQVEEVYLKLNIKNNQGLSCGEELKQNLENNLFEHEIGYNINKNCNSPVVEAYLIDQKTEKILDQAEFKFSSDVILDGISNQNQEKEKDSEKVPLSLLIFIISGSLLIVLLIVLVAKFKKGTLLMLILLSGLFFGMDETSADTISLNYTFQRSGYPLENVSVVMSYSLNKTTFDPGETIRADFSISSPAGTGTLTTFTSNTSVYNNGCTILGSDPMLINDRHNMNIVSKLKTASLNGYVNNLEIYPGTCINISRADGSSWSYEDNGSVVFWDTATSVPGNYEAVFSFVDLAVIGIPLLPYSVTYQGATQAMFSIPYTVTTTVPPTPTPCVPDCSCKSSTCVGSTCPDGCGGDCAGTLPGTCGPSDAYCDGVPYDDSCGNSTCTGTKECLDYCNTSPGGYYCTGSTGSGNPGLTLNWLYDWCSAYCSSGSCNCTWFYNSCDPDSTPCGNEYCDASDPDCEYCNGSDVWTKDQGDQTTCTGTAGGCSSYLDECNHALKEPCEVGYICKETGTCTADCVPKASTWTEV